jgi:hypothetical protein
MDEIELDSWEEFLAEVALLRKSLHSPPVFRGQRDASWPLSTTLERTQSQMLFSDYYRIISRVKPQIESLTGNEWQIPGYPEVEHLVNEYDAFNLKLWNGECPAYAYMVHLRHHGFPSPLLDWTRSPYVAAFFTFNGAVDTRGRVSIYALAEQRFTLTGNDMPLVYRYGPYVKTHRRHFLQQSEYTLCLIYDDCEWRFGQYNSVFAKGRGQQGFCWKYTIPTTERIKVLRLLDEHNLNAFSLFGSEESMMETLATREFLQKQVETIPITEPTIPTES